MDLSDLLVSYNQVTVPSYYKDTIEPTVLTPINFNSNEVTRIKHLPKFKGFVNNPIEEQLSNDYSSNEIVQYFIEKGLTKAQAKGIYGNIMQESGGNIRAKSSDGYNSYGLAQWTGARKARLFSKYGNNPNMQQQLDFLWYELNTTENKALQSLKNTTNVEDATRVFMQEFERPAQSAANLKRRINYAKNG